MSMLVRRCRTCGRGWDEKWIYDEKSGMHKCPACGMYSQFENSKKTDADDEIYSSICSDLDNLEFEAAEKKLKDLRVKKPDDSMVFFLSALADNCVCYTDADKGDGTKIPTLNNIKQSSLFENEFVKKALSMKSAPIQLEEYKRVFDYIEQKRSEIYKTYQEDKYKFDIFISCQVSDRDETTRQIIKYEDGTVKKSESYHLAEQVYDHLMKNYASKGVKTFLSEKMKSEMAGHKYENVIFSALHSARLFILVVTSRFNIDWMWVRNEWKRYLYIMNNANDGVERRFMIITKDGDKISFPYELRKIQYLDWSRGMEVASALDSNINDISEKTMSHIKAKSFDGYNVSGTIEAVKTEALQSKKLNTKANTLQTGVQNEIDSIIDEIAELKKTDAKYASRRALKFEQLKEIYLAYPDAHKAKLFYLLSKADVRDFDEVFFNINSIKKNENVVNSFFELAEEAEAKKRLGDIYKAIAETFKIKRDYVQGPITFASVALTSYIIPYYSYFQTNQLSDLRNLMLGQLESGLPYDETFIEALFTLSKAIDGDDLAKYIDIRIKVVQLYNKVKREGDFPNILEEILDDILKHDPTNHIALFAKFNLVTFDIIETDVKKMTENRCELLVQDREDELIVGDKIELSIFNRLFAYAPKELKPWYNYYFLLVIAGNNLELDGEDSQELKIHTGDEDHELNAVELFNKYVEFELPDVVLNSNKSTPLNTHVHALKNDKNDFNTLDSVASPYKPLMNAVYAMARRLHKDGQFEEAVKMYGLFEAQLTDAASDIAVIGAYFESLAVCKSRNVKEVIVADKIYSNTRINAIKVVRRGNNPNFKNTDLPFFEFIDEIKIDQSDLRTSVQGVKDALNSIPDYIISNITRLDSVQVEVEKEIGSLTDEQRALFIEQYEDSIVEMRNSIKAVKEDKGFLKSFAIEPNDHDPKRIEDALKKVSVHQGIISHEKLDHYTKTLTNLVERRIPENKVEIINSINEARANCIKESKEKSRKVILPSFFKIPFVLIALVSLIIYIPELISNHVLVFDYPVAMAVVNILLSVIALVPTIIQLRGGGDKYGRKKLPIIGKILRIFSYIINGLFLVIYGIFFIDRFIFDSPILVIQDVLLLVTSAFLFASNIALEDNGKHSLLGLTMVYTSIITAFVGSLNLLVIRGFMEMPLSVFDRTTGLILLLSGVIGLWGGGIIEQFSNASCVLTPVSHLAAFVLSIVFAVKTGIANRAEPEVMHSAGVAIIIFIFTLSLLILSTLILVRNPNSRYAADRRFGNVIMRSLILPANAVLIVSIIMGTAEGEWPLIDFICASPITLIVVMAFGVVGLIGCIGSLRHEDGFHGGGGQIALAIPHIVGEGAYVLFAFITMIGYLEFAVVRDAIDVEFIMAILTMFLPIVLTIPRVILTIIDIARG